MTFQENRNIPSSHPGHGQGPAGASLSDLLTAVKNVVTAISNLQQAYLGVVGTSSKQVTAATGALLLKTGAGRLVSINVTVAGTPSSYIYVVDNSNASAITPVLALVPAVVGNYTLNLPYSVGLVVVPAPSSVLSAVYS